jgi:hypothetical protein
MKKIPIEQLETISAGKITWACVGQVATGVEVLATVAAIGVLAISPLGWFCFALSAISLTSSVIADPTACD